ncbi:gamma-aminobutyric acid receptor subunit rho-1 isoform X1 [Eurytemora carolleeae]|uniref:gamma-aminobutyric acid receptor subunit rho-1 isoform X1 n=1 Tax=Eurytemora carolleeae TaxID=1294199 RepID=UPI000C7603DD|nr:gamma-aminobutyric acid receptor subunit rho-1 isoform X1 [Eurytemora carolleeae]XP_023331020.1 gamma-aminobutyric acid receptor subunit rho-1 isoform X1 [Eurytemora carolleeae]XP_023331021.1 gamma-aminobutyric acid receptor subunit rho-1 isoform X1 [Eurytemora carolleeae]XP_023331022.1 gamma-aminobutyric acid receptor subunit rho-1 isoform X1 [Eurytemora carolleeae]|eukprot:XP_023331019.1 gamma-aminobutyric acid receptor subunit rho-1-like isoform X1 [Eurytemora affinis]
MRGWLLLLYLPLSYKYANSKRGFKCSAGISKSICLPDEYSKFELPFVDSTNEIYIGIDIDEVLRINDKDYSITFSTYFNVEWVERRLTVRKDWLDQMGHIENSSEPLNMPMNLEFVKDLWLPNIFIYNLKTFKVIDVLSKMAGLWINTNKKILYSQQTHITFICPMRFDKFPLDTQRCKFQVGSYSYDDSKMMFITQSAQYQKNGRNTIALDYDIEIEPLQPLDMILDYGNLGNFSLSGFEMVLTRYVSTYIITYYLPSGLFVIVSWISFLIPMDVIPGRMALLVTLFLVLVNIFNTVTTNTPKAEGLTAIEAWMLACILFVFGALIE